MKKSIKQISAVVIVALSALMFITSSSSSKKGAEVITTANKTQPKEKSPIIIERYPDKETIGVRHQLDSLLKRINKRDDFHGSVLVAKG